MRLWSLLVSHLTTSQWLLDVQHLFVDDQWHVLGPFTIGTREAAWGADPLEELGGIRTLEETNDRHFRSSLASNGTITWTRHLAHVEHNSDDIVTITIDVSFIHIDWSFLQHVYGWAALQWQGWARGYVMVNSRDSALYNLYLDSIQELWTDGELHYGGDFYGMHRSPILLSLQPGKHKIDVRLVRDVRSMGGITELPSTTVRLKLVRTSSGLHKSGSILIADRLDDWKGPHASTFASVVLRNDGDSDIYITGLKTKRNVCIGQLLSRNPIRLVPGQSRSIGLQIDCVPGTSAYLSIDLWFEYFVGQEPYQRLSYYVRSLGRPPVSRYEPHVVTYLHRAGIVSHALLRPPAQLCNQNTTLPVFLALHGAGVDIDSDMSRHALDDIADICAWTLVPSGSTSWSGDDWHIWGWADVEAAITSIQAWIDQVGWQGPGVDTSKWLVTGHSNGGQGVWYALTHYPDHIMAAAPVSGYSSIQTYVPYSLWHITDPRRTAVVQAQLNNYRHELLLRNAKDIDVFQQHGSMDDNVPPFHSRLMYEMAYRAGINSSYYEVPGRSHWWDGVMTTEPLTNFYRQHLDQHEIATPRTFSLVTAGTGHAISRQGFHIDGLIVPGQLGTIDVALDRTTAQCSVNTSNVEFLRVEAEGDQRCSSITIGDQVFESQSRLGKGPSRLFKRTAELAWVERSEDACLRIPGQSGGLEAILKSNGTLQIVQLVTEIQNHATQVANNLHQYFAADAALATSYEAAKNASGNIISLAIGSDLIRASLVADCPLHCQIDIQHGELIIDKQGSNLYTIDLIREEIAAAAFLRPLPDNRLELLLWSIDVTSLSIATRLLPLITGSGFPDFVIGKKTMSSHGLEGVFALGFLDSQWCPSSTSYFARDL